MSGWRGRASGTAARAAGTRRGRTPGACRGVGLKLSNRPGVFKERREILFYEASEGGAGVLRQLAEAPAVLPALARRALAICHYDPDTGEDWAADRCGRPNLFGAVSE